jgi:iron complex outermembrane receptor protein
MHHTSTPPFRLLMLCSAIAALVTSPSLYAADAASPAEQAASAPGPAASAPTRARPAADKPQQVEIKGTSPTDTQEDRRQSTASRITFGREELDRMGDTSLGEVLKRLPGVTMGGPPGRGSAPRMRGMGGGYTQILIDGQRMPPGFSLDSIAPEQIERIEIMRAPVAEHGTRAIAGTINVVMRADFKRKADELKVGAGVEGHRAQTGGSWMRNGQTESIGYNLNAAVMHGGQDNEATTRIIDRDASGTPTLDQQEHSTGTGHRTGLFANGRLQFKLGPGNSLDLQPFVHMMRTRGEGQSTLTQALPALSANTPASDINQPAYTSSQTQSSGQTQMARLAGTWLTGTPDGGRLQLRFGSMLATNSSVSDRIENGGSAAALTGSQRIKHDDSRQRDLSLDMNGKFSQLLADRHSASAGWELQHNTRNTSHQSLVNGQAILADFGEDLDARIDRVALYAQDEWDWSKTFSFYLGGRWEAINTASDSAQARVRNHSAVLTPLAHMVWKLPDTPRDQVRLSLTRSYRSPDTNQLIALPAISARYPDLTRPNQPTSPDRAGNPNLKPELATGLELGFEHYLDAGGIFSANLFARQINNLIRTVRSLETVSWSPVQRWVARPQNIGQADAAGLELEAKARASDLWATDLPISLRANLTLMWSRVGQVMGPNNRLEGQPPYTANLGADWPIKGTPLTVGASLNYTPGFELQQIDSQTARQSNKNVVDAYALWRINADASLRLSVNNASARRYDTGSTTTLADGSSAASDTSTRTYTTVNLRGEFRF